MNTSFVTQTRRHKRDTTDLKELQKRLAFLHSRVNSRSDPAIQALINRTKEAIDVAAAAERERFDPKYKPLIARIR